MRMTISRLTLALSAVGLLFIQGCGGGAEPGTSQVSFSVIDGPIKGATVCLDKNKNEQCDAGEPTGLTNSAGQVTLTIAKVDIGQYAAVALVDQKAVEFETGKAPDVAFTMISPVGQTVISPFTTLVHQAMNEGMSLEEAVEFVQDATGIGASPLEDFTKSAAQEGGVSPALIARALALATQAQLKVVQGSRSGLTADSAGVGYTKGDLAAVVNSHVLSLAPQLAVSVQDLNGDASLRTTANQLIQSNGLSKQAVASAVGNLKLAISPTVDPTGAWYRLKYLSFSDPNNLTAYLTSANSTQAKQDKFKRTKFIYRRYQITNGELATWSAGTSPRRQLDLSWNGKEWVSCSLNFENTSQQLDSLGNSSYSYCDRQKGWQSFSALDVSGQSMAKVFKNADIAGFASDYRFDRSYHLGSATFPTGSTIRYTKTTATSNAFGYLPVGGTTVWRFSDDVAAGGKAADHGSQMGCNSPETFGRGSFEATTLEILISRTRGTPCINGNRAIVNGVHKTDGTLNAGSPALNSLSPDEGWYQSTVEIGKLGPDGTDRSFAPLMSTSAATSYYTSNQILAAAFISTRKNGVRYYSCKERIYDGSRRNCVRLNEGSYTITQRGDARVLTFQNLPGRAVGTSWNRAFIERNGHVYYGYLDKKLTYSGLSLNDVATQALFTQLNITEPALKELNPNQALSLTPASFYGEYWGTLTGDEFGTWSLSLNGPERSSCYGYTNVLGNLNGSGCTSTVTPDSSGSTSSPATSATLRIRIPIQNSTVVLEGVGKVDFQTGKIVGTWVSVGGSKGTFEGQRQ